MTMMMDHVSELEEQAEYTEPTPSEAELLAKAYEIKMPELGDQTWKALAACLPGGESGFRTDDFFIDTEIYGNSKRYQRMRDRAKALCQECAVQIDCLDFALRNHINYGIWGGTTEPDRRRMHAERVRAS